METLTRWAGYLAMTGGALVAVLALIVAYDPETGAWFAFFLVVALLGGAVLGFQKRTAGSTGRLGRGSAWLSTIGAVGLLALFGYAEATNGLSGNYSAASDPLTPFWIVTALAWFIGNIGFAVALIRAKVLSSIGAWLVLAGALVGAVVSAVLGENLPSAAYLLFGLFGIGWMVIGFGALRPRPGTSS